MNGGRVRKPGLPGYIYVEHVGLVVPDLEQAVTFFRDVLGGDELYRSSRAGDRRFMEDAFDVGSDASFELAMMRLPPNLNIELFEWAVRDARPDRPRVSDPGGHHLCVYVDGIEAAMEYLHAFPGVRLLGEIKTVVGKSPVAGSRWIYFVTPWGLHMELVERARVANPPSLIAPTGRARQDV